MGCCGNSTKDGAIELTGDGNGNEVSGKYGTKRAYDPNFSGPIKNRSCTDIICCILFLAFLVCMVIIGILAYSWGDPYRLLYPTDSRGNLCGVNSFKDRPNLLFFDLLECVPKSPSLSSISSLTKCHTPQICVKSCPLKNQFWPTMQRTDLFCQYHANLNLSTSELVNQGLCAKYTLQSEALLGRCIPTVLGNELKSFLSDNGILNSNGRNATSEDVKWGTIAQSVLLNLQNVGKRVMADVQESWYWLLAAFGIAMGVCLLYIIMMRWVAGLMVWLTTYAVLTLTGYATYYCFTEYKRLAAIDNSSLSYDFLTNLDQYKNKKETWLALGCICAAVLLILVLLLIALRNRIRLAVQLIKEGSRAITAMVSTLFFPLLPWLLQLILFAWFVAVMAFLATSGDAEYTRNQNNSIQNAACTAAEALQEYASVNVSCSFEKYKSDANVLRLQVAHLFGWFWLLNFIIAFGQCVLAGAFASWYWAWDKKTDVPTLPLLASMGRTLRYHTGSLAFGSLIIAFVQIIRAALEYLEYKLKGTGGEPSPVAKFILKCLKCFFWCLEKFLKFLNRNAYIEIAVYGKNFCTSAKNAFFLLMRNILRVAVLDKVTDFLLFIGKLTVTAGMGVASFYFFSNRSNLNYYLTPVIIITIASWCIASGFFGVYEMAIDTIFLSFLEDCERHDGSPEKPYYMSKKLRSILGKKNKKPEGDS